MFDELINELQYALNNLINDPRVYNHYLVVNATRDIENKAEDLIIEYKDA